MRAFLRKFFQFSKKKIRPLIQYQRSFAHVQFCADPLPRGLRSDSQALAALCTTSIDDLAAVLGAHAGQKAMNFLALTLLGLKSSLHGCILRKNLSPVWGLMWSQIGDRLAIQQYIA